MKKLITYSTALITTCILLSSCMSNMSMTKRHYTKGYYVDYTKNEPNRLMLNKETKVVTIKSIVTPPVAQSISIQYTAAVSINTNTCHTTVAANNQKTGYYVIAQGNTVASSRPKAEIIARSTELSIYAPSALLTVNEDSPHRQGLSLFWLVILVILVLWALGVLVGGIGGIIYLLLLVAAILLILWLLRIV